MSDELIELNGVRSMDGISTPVDYGPHVAVRSIRVPDVRDNGLGVSIEDLLKYKDPATRLLAVVTKGEDLIKRAAALPLPKTEMMDYLYTGTPVPINAIITSMAQANIVRRTHQIRVAMKTGAVDSHVLAQADQVEAEFPRFERIISSIEAGKAPTDVVSKELMEALKAEQAKKAVLNTVLTVGGVAVGGGLLYLLLGALGVFGK
ncbi:MAG: hypothetical protein ACREH5_03225 [Candidatus Omnitrophota bacterium]